MDKEQKLQHYLLMTAHDLSISFDSVLGTLLYGEISNLKQNKAMRQEMIGMQHEIINSQHTLRKLILIYQLHHKQYVHQLSSVNVYDVIDTEFLQQESLCAAHKLDYVIECDKKQLWFMDTNLVSLALADVITHILLFGQNEMKISVTDYDSRLAIDCLYKSNDLQEQEVFKSFTDQDILPEQKLKHLSLGLIETMLNLHDNNGSHGHCQLIIDGDWQCISLNLPS